MSSGEADLYRNVTLDSFIRCAVPGCPREICCRHFLADASRVRCYQHAGNRERRPEVRRLPSGELVPGMFFPNTTSIDGGDAA
jgi:hypothetical protein